MTRTITAPRIARIAAGFVVILGGHFAMMVLAFAVLLPSLPADTLEQRICNVILAATVAWGLPIWATHRYGKELDRLFG